MPSARQRRKRVMQTKIVSVFVSKPIESISIEDDELLTNIQTIIDEIIETISTTLDIDIVKTLVEELLTLITSNQEMYESFDIIETKLIDVVTNISKGVNINIIRNRIEYIKDLI
jgi:hypothetical protein